MFKSLETQNDDWKWRILYIYIQWLIYYKFTHHNMCRVLYRMHRILSLAPVFFSRAPRWSIFSLGIIPRVYHHFQLFFFRDASHVSTKSCFRYWKGLVYWVTHSVFLEKTPCQKLLDDFPMAKEVSCSGWGEVPKEVASLHDASS